MADLKPHDLLWGGVGRAYCMCLNNAFLCLIRCIIIYSESRNTLKMVPKLYDACKLVNLNFMDSGGRGRVITACV